MVANEREWTVLMKILGENGSSKKIVANVCSTHLPLRFGNSIKSQPGCRDDAWPDRMVFCVTFLSFLPFLKSPQRLIKDIHFRFQTLSHCLRSIWISSSLFGLSWSRSAWFSFLAFHTSCWSLFHSFSSSSIATPVVYDLDQTFGRGFNFLNTHLFLIIFCLDKFLFRSIPPPSSLFTRRSFSLIWS